VLTSCLLAAYWLVKSRGLDRCDNYRTFLWAKTGKNTGGWKAWLFGLCQYWL